MTPRQLEVQERILAAVVATDSGCWEWQRSRQKNGYGALRLKAEGISTAHRAAWFAFKGSPDGCVLHRCDNRACCNPEHLFLGTYADNNHDMLAKGRARPGKSSWTHCKRDHPLSGDNLIINRSGHRVCRTCKNAGKLASYHRLKSKGEQE